MPMNRRFIIPALAITTGVSWLFVIARSPGADKPLELSPLVVTAVPYDPVSGSGGIAALETITPLDADGERLTEIFQRVPGLIAQDSFGGFDPPRLAVRGSGIQSAPTSRGLAISFLGMPLNSADGSFNLALLESTWIESAELTRGPAAGVPMLGGSLALGDAAAGFAQGNSVRAFYGSDETASLSGRGMYGADGLSLAGRAAFYQSDGWRPHSRQERESMFAAVRTALDDDSDLTIRFFGSTPWYEVPGPMTKHDALNNPTAPVESVVRDQPRRDIEYAQLSARASTRWTGGYASFGIGGVHQRDDFRQLAANGISITTAKEAYLVFNAGNDWNPSGHHTEFAALLQSGWWDASRYLNDSGNTGALIGEQRLRPLSLTAAIDHRLEIVKNQHLEIGGSILTAQRDINDGFDPGPGVPSVDLGFSGTRFAPRAAWSWSPVSEATFVVSWARSYEPPTYNDLLFTDGPMDARFLRSAPLDWQRADSFEVGAHGRRDRFSWSSYVYYAPWRNEFLRLVDENGSPRGTVNAGRTIHTGWETAIEWDLLPESETDLAFWATYNLTDARFDEDPVYGDRRLAGVPPHSGALGLRAVSPGGWFVAPGLQWQAGETYGDHFHNVGYGGFGLCSLEIGRRHPDGWSVTLGIHNLFDRKTIASTAGVLDRAPDPENTAIFLPAAGRSVDLCFEYVW
jgi:iron complex outermembrane receptor protein